MDKVKRLRVNITLINALRKKGTLRTYSAIASMTDEEVEAKFQELGIDMEATLEEASLRLAEDLFGKAPAEE